MTAPPGSLRLWVLSPELHKRGGTERSLAEQLERWRERFEVSLFTMDVDGVDVDGIDVHRIPRPPGPQLTRYLWWLIANTTARRWEAVRSGRPDLVHSPGINALDADAMSVHIVFRKYWSRVETQIRSDLASPLAFPRALHRALLYGGLLRTLERRVYAGPATIWAISAGDARELERLYGRPPGSVPAVPHGIDTCHFSPERRTSRREGARRELGVEGRRVALLIGNDAYKKGADLAIRALGSLPRDVVLAVAGRLDAGAVRRWAREAGVAERVHVWPHHPDVIRYYAAADVVVAPSREDAFHLPAIEAMACGVPLVVSAAAGVSELLEDGRHALVVADPVNADTLAFAMNRVFAEPGLAAQLARHGRALAVTRSWDTEAESAAELIEREASTPRVLVLATDPAGTGGIQQVTRVLLRALGDRLGPERIGLLPVWGGGPAGLPPCRILRRRRPVPDPPWRVSPEERVRYATTAALAARRWRHRLVIVAAHPHLAPVARLCAAGAGARYAVWCHGTEVWGPLDRLTRWGLDGAHLVFAPSQYTVRQLRSLAGVKRPPVRVVSHAVAPPDPGPVVQHRFGSPRVLTVSRLTSEHRYKGVEALLGAWPLVRERVTNAELVVVGDGPDRPRLEALAVSAGIGGSVRFAGRVDDDDLVVLYASSWLFALPGRASVGDRREGEGFGLVFLEAAMAGLPVVAGRGGAVPEVVQDGQTGLLVDPDSREETAEAIVRVLADEGLAARLGAAALQRAKTRFSYDRFAAEIAEMIDTLAQIPARSAGCTSS